MREIKFRAFNKITKKMFQVNDIDGLMQNTHVCCKHGDACEEMRGIDGFLDEVELMQYTGLKDKNGKEIYEGDVLKGDGIIGRQQTKEVYFENGSFKVKDYFTKTEIVDSEVLMVGFPDYISMWIFTNKFDIEIIGNIYTTPDLKEQS